MTSASCPSLFLSLQPPPQIYDKQLDEREHSIDEWKGKALIRVGLASASVIPQRWG